MMQSELRIQELPQRMSDPEILPAMNPIIQRLSQEFPKTACQIIAKNGLHIEEFNLLQEKVEKNFFYRVAVQNEIKKIEEEIHRPSSAPAATPTSSSPSSSNTSSNKNKKEMRIWIWRFPFRILFV